MDAMTPEQIELLWEASKTAELHPAQRRVIQPVNPWMKRGPIASALRREVIRLNPRQAEEWREEAERGPVTLALLAARLGLK